MQRPKKVNLKHPLGNATNSVTPERLTYLIGRLRNGCITQIEREELGCSYIKLALRMAARYSRQRPEKGDDYASAALFGIAYALDRAKEKLYDDNLTAWVIVNIRRFIRQFYEKDHLVRVPATTYSKAKKQGRELRTVTAVVMDEREIDSGNNEKHLSKCYKIRSTIAGGFLALKEMLGLSAKSDRDRIILEKRSQGYTDAEIGQQLGISTAYVHRLRKEMEDRFDRLNKE